MGVGFALEEEMLFDAKGRLINPNLTNYIMPTSLDMPKIEVDIVDNYDPTGPFGAKGCWRAHVRVDGGGYYERDPRCRRRAHHLAAGHRGEGVCRHQGEAREGAEAGHGGLSVPADCPAAGRLLA